MKFLSEKVAKYEQALLLISCYLNGETLTDTATGEDYNLKNNPLVNISEILRFELKQENLIYHDFK